MPTIFRARGVDIVRQPDGRIKATVEYLQLAAEQGEKGREAEVLKTTVLSREVLYVDEKSEIEPAVEAHLRTLRRSLQDADLRGDFIGKTIAEDTP